MVCHDASNSLWPSNKDAMPAFPLQGKSFKNGVKFSVHTTSLGSVPYNKCIFSAFPFGWSPSGLKDITGLVVRVSSMKFSEAQKRPERAFVRVSHF